MTPRLFSAGTDYAYAFGRIGVLLQNLPDQSDIDRLVAAHSRQELMQILSEIKFTAPVMATVTDPNDLIPAMEQWIRKEMESMVPEQDREIFDILWLREDSALLAYLIKQYHRLTANGSRQPRSSNSTHDTKALERLVLKGINEVLPAHLVSFVQQMKERKDETPVQIDTAVAQYVADRQTMLALRSGSRHIQQYVAHFIDLQNIRTARRLDSDDTPEDHLLHGGEIDPKRLTTDRHELANLIRASTLPSGLADDIERADDTSITLERGLAKAIAHSIGEMRAVPLTIEPVFAFAIIALSQLRVLRSILIGKSTGLKPDEILHMLPPFLGASPFAS